MTSKSKYSVGVPIQRIDSVAKTAAAARIIKEMSSSMANIARATITTQAASAPIDPTKPARLTRQQVPVPTKFIHTVKVGEEDIDLEQVRSTESVIVCLVQHL